MIESPYRSSACKRYILDKIIAGLRKDALSPHGSGILLKWGGVGIVTQAVPTTVVDSFTQPLGAPELEGQDDPKNGIVFQSTIIDGRSWLRENRDPSKREVTYSVATHGDGHFQILRAQLQSLWQAPDFNRQDLVRVGDLPAVVFMRWLGGSLTHRLGLDEVQEQQAKLVSAYYYYNLFYRKEEFNSVVKAKTVRQASVLLRLPYENAMRALESVDYLDTVDDFVKALKIVLQTPRTDNLNVGLLWTMLSNAWFGTNKTETIAVALEHPPTWLAMVYFAANDRSYKKSPIGTIALNNIRSQNDHVLTRSIKALVKSVGDSPIFQD